MNQNAVATTELFRSLFEDTTANEIANNLSCMSDVFLQHAPFDRIALANCNSLATRLICFFYEVEKNMKQETRTPIESAAIAGQC